MHMNTQRLVDALKNMSEEQRQELETAFEQLHPQGSESRWDASEVPKQPLLSYIAFLETNIRTSTPSCKYRPV